MTRRLQALMIANAGLVLLLGMLAGLPFGFHLLGQIALWPLPFTLDVQIPGTGGDYTVDHSAVLVLIDPRARVAGYFTPPYDIGALAADCVARAIARGVYEARVPGPAWSGPPSWHGRFGR